MELINFQGNYIDLIILFVLFVWVVDGWERGFFMVLADLVAFLGSFLFGLRFYTRAAQLFMEYFSLSRGFANALGFFMVYSVAHGIIALVFVGVIREIPLKHFPKLFRKLLGIFPAAVNGLIIVAAVLTMAVSLPIRSDVKEAVVDSEVGGFLIRRTSVIERSINAVFGGAIEESLAFLTVKPESTERIDLGFEVEKPNLKVSEKLETAMLALINHEREAQKVGKVNLDHELASVAREHARDMFEKGYFSHISLEGEDVGDRLREAQVDYLVAGENLAFAPSLEIAHDGLMQSPGHRENILASEFGRIGIGVIDGGSYGKMFVQVFGD